MFGSVLILLGDNSLMKDLRIFTNITAIEAFCSAFSYCRHPYFNVASKYGNNVSVSVENMLYMSVSYDSASYNE